jgi:VanZ family protein
MPSGPNATRGVRPLPAVLAWAGAIFISSSIPSVQLPHIEIWNADKLVHFVIYSVLAFLVNRLLRSQTRFASLSTHHYQFTVVFTLLYGVSDEIHQAFVPGRTPSLLDLLADGGGALLFCLLAGFMASRKTSPRRNDPPA